MVQFDAYGQGYSEEDLQKFTGIALAGLLQKDSSQISVTDTDEKTIESVAKHAVQIAAITLEALIDFKEEGRAAAQKAQLEIDLTTSQIPEPTEDDTLKAAAASGNTIPGTPQASLNVQPENTKPIDSNGYNAPAESDDGQGNDTTDISATGALPSANTSTTPTEVASAPTASGDSTIATPQAATVSNGGNDTAASSAVDSPIGTGDGAQPVTQTDTDENDEETEAHEEDAEQ